jgi:hypothetical protein
VTIRLPILLLVVLLFECVAGAAAPQQNRSAAATAGTVYFYYLGFQQPPGMFGWTPGISVLVDGRVVASLKTKTFFGVKLTPGRHTLASKSRRTNPKETAIELDIRPRQQVFIRLEMMIAGMGIVKYTAHLRVVGQEEGGVMVAELQPLDVSEIEDKARVTTELPTPAEDDDSTISQTARLSAPLPDEQGIYALQQGSLQRIPGETTTLRMTSAWGLTAILKNARSGTRLKVPLEFVIRSSPDTIADEYVLMHLFTRNDRREFRTLKGGQSGWQGPERMMVPFESRRIAPNVYHLTVLAVPKGEYGFVSPGAALKDSAASTVTYTFGVD